MVRSKFADLVERGQRPRRSDFGRQKSRPRSVSAKSRGRPRRPRFQPSVHDWRSRGISARRQPGESSTEIASEKSTPSQIALSKVTPNTLVSRSSAFSKLAPSTAARFSNAGRDRSRSGLAPRRSASFGSPERLAGKVGIAQDGAGKVGLTDHRATHLGAFEIGLVIFVPMPAPGSDRCSAGPNGAADIHHQRALVEIGADHAGFLVESAPPSAAPRKSALVQMVQRNSVPTRLAAKRSASTSREPVRSQAGSAGRRCWRESLHSLRLSPRKVFNVRSARWPRRSFRSQTGGRREFAAVHPLHVAHSPIRCRRGWHFRPNPTRRLGDMRANTSLSAFMPARG